VMPEQPFVPAGVVEDGWLAAETVRLLDFAAGSRDPHGGFGRQDRQGELAPGGRVQLWVTGRMTHVFALGELLGHPGCGELVEHGLAGLRGRLADVRFGGWYAEVDVSRVLDDRKLFYQHCFVLLGAASAFVAGHTDAADLLAEACEITERWFWDGAAAMVRESWNREFTEPEPYRGANAAMHGVEAFLAVADATGETVWRERALLMTAFLIDGVARRGVKDGHWRIVEHFDPGWSPLPDYHRERPADPFRPYGATVGHTLEWSRLCLHLRAALGASAPDWLLEHSRALFASAVTDGWAVDGADGFVYTTDWDGTPVVHERMHWVVAEAIAAATVLAAVTGDECYVRWQRMWWDYVRRHVVDTVHGSWHHELDCYNRPSATVWADKADAYHAVQATLISRLPVRGSLAVALRETMRGAGST